MTDYNIQVFCTDKFCNTTKYDIKLFNTWKDFLIFYDINKYRYSFKICEKYKINDKSVMNLLFNCGKYSKHSKHYDNFFELLVNPENNKDHLRVYRHIRLDYLSSEIIHTYERYNLLSPQNAGGALHGVNSSLL